MDDAVELAKRLQESAEADRREDERKRWLRGLGVITRLVVYAALFCVLYVYWPESKWDRPIGSLTINDIVAPLGFLVTGFVLVKWLFEPSDDDGVREAWGGLGILLIVGSVLLTVYLGW